MNPVGGNFHLPPFLNLLPTPSRLQLTPNRSSVPAGASASISGAPAPSGVHMGELSAEETGDRLQFSAGLFLKHPLCPALGKLDSLPLCSMKSSEG